MKSSWPSLPSRSKSASRTISSLSSLETGISSVSIASRRLVAVTADPLPAKKLPM